MLQLLGVNVVENDLKFISVYNLSVNLIIFLWCECCRFGWHTRC